jgi:dTDP-4-dehydrorhamnose reductase
MAFFFMRTIVITGAKGLLGEACCRLLKDDYLLIPLTRADVDFTNTGELSDVLSRLKFDYLINNAAMSGLEQCLDHPEIAMQVNVVAPKMMAEICDQKSAKMLQISTDYVLDGRANKVHDEFSQTRESGVYSKTKIASELAVTEACENSIIGRVSWLFGYGRETFVDQVMNTALRGDQACYIWDKYSIPNFCDDLVPVMSELLESKITGVVHLSNDADPETWFSYAEKVIKIAIDLGILNECFNSIDQSNLDEIAFFKQERPRYTAMRPRRLLEEATVRVRNWECGVRDYLSRKYENSLTDEKF